MKKYGAAGIPEALRHFHVLKHCCVTHLLSKGFGVERVQAWIGHANIQSTMEYAKVTNARRDDMGAAVEGDVAVTGLSKLSLCTYPQVAQPLSGHWLASMGE